MANNVNWKRVVAAIQPPEIKIEKKPRFYEVYIQRPRGFCWAATLQTYREIYVFVDGYLEGRR